MILNGVERPVSFDVPCLDERAEVLCTAWPNGSAMPFAEYGFRPGQGLVTDMNAIRRDEELDNLHSIYVDQWDWEKVISREGPQPALFAGKPCAPLSDAVCSTDGRAALADCLPSLQSQAA